MWTLKKCAYIFCVLIAGFAWSRSAHAACSNPTGIAGDILYDDGNDTFVGCTQDNGWVEFYPGNPSFTAPGSNCTNPAGTPGDITYASNIDSYVGCTGSRGWVEFYPSSPTFKPKPSGCSNIGEQCDDNSFYIGEVSGRKIYATTSATEVTDSWNDGSGNYIVTDATSTTDGEANTVTLLGLTGASDYPYQAAEYCSGLSTLGHSDWYLPAIDELNLFYNGGSLLANVRGDPDGYWSSTEDSSTDAFVRFFKFSFNSTDYKANTSRYIRCVRSFDMTCSNPTGQIGDISYSTNFDGFVGCTSTWGWVTFHQFVDPCESSPTIGVECLDGSFYVGQVGGQDIFAAGSDEDGTLQWNNNQDLDTPADSTTDGQANTSALIGSGTDNDGDDFGPHPAADACWSKVAHGHDDWYLPATDEMDLFWNSGSPVANVQEDGSTYWTSNESGASSGDAFYQRFDTGYSSLNPKNNYKLVRCVRK